MPGSGQGLLTPGQPRAASPGRAALLRGNSAHTRAAPAVKPAGRGHLLLLRQVTHSPFLKASPCLEMYLDAASAVFPSAELQLQSSCAIPRGPAAGAVSAARGWSHVLSLGSWLMNTPRPGDVGPHSCVLKIPAALMSSSNQGLLPACSPKARAARQSPLPHRAHCSTMAMRQAGPQGRATRV